MRQLLTLSLTLALPLHLAAQAPPSPPHLEPCRTPLFSRSDDIVVRSRLQAALGLDQMALGSRRRVAVLLVQPSFEPEHAVSLFVSDRDTDPAVLTAVQALRHIGQANSVDVPVRGQPNTFNTVIRAKPASVPVSRYQRDISPSLASELLAVLTSGTMASRYPPSPRALLDGTVYTFGVVIPGHGPLCGQTQSPEAASDPGRLVTLGQALFRFIRDRQLPEPFLTSALAACRDGA